METQNDKVVFIEYSTANKGQHFITVTKKIDGRKRVIGKIYREFDSAQNKPKYKAFDSHGNQIFFNVETLYELKKQFVEHGKTLSYAIPKNPNDEKRMELKEELKENKIMSRETELKEIRDSNADKSKERKTGIER